MVKKELMSSKFFTVNNVQKSYGQGDTKVKVLKGITTELEKGKICVILGPSGSGKSTLLNVIAGLEQADGGTICVDGEEITALDEKHMGGEIMRNPLIKRYPRDLKSNFGRYLAVFLMLMVTIAIMSGFLCVSDGIQIALKDSWKESKVEDGMFSSYSIIDTKTLRSVEELGVSVYENHYINENIKVCFEFMRTEKIQILLRP